MKRKFKICVVGAGMFGSSASKYLSDQLGGEILLIGKSEPHREDYDKTDIFGAYYDEGRITRTLDVDSVWGQLAASSIQRYRDIERRSGVRFFVENGFIAGGEASSKFVAENIQTAKITKTPLSIYSSKDSDKLKKIFPYMDVPKEGFNYIFEEKNAGSINPRNLVKAQLKLSVRNRCQYIDDIVTQLENAGDAWRVFSERNGSFLVDKVLLCTGSYGNFHQLISSALNIDIQFVGTSLIRIPVADFTATQISGASTLSGSKQMPCGMIEYSVNDGKLPSSGGYHTHPRFLYFMAPLIYPDGVYYLKFGDSYDFWKVMLNSPQEIAAWWRNGPKNCEIEAQKMAKIAKIWFPDLDTSKFVVDVCVVATTPSQRPYIDEISSNLFVALGGNGYGAKSSDEIGRLAANMTLGKRWDFPYKKELFKCQYKSRPKL